MGCITHVMPSEAAMNKVVAIHQEIETGTLPSSYRSDYYDGGVNDHLLDEATEKLCSAFKKLSKAKIQKMSLEAQMWWRDHQAFDEQRLKEEQKAKKDEQLKEAALSKLSREEKRVLGLL